MKRIVSLALICTILVLSLALPAAATSVETPDPFFDVLDYGFPNGGSSLNIYGSGSAECFFKLPYARVIKYVDMIVEVPGVTSGLTAQIGGPSSKSNLTCVNISGNYFRIYGTCYYSSTTFYVYFQATGLSVVIFNSVKVSFDRMTHYDIDAYCKITSNELNDTIHYVHTDTINSRTWKAGTEYLLLAYRLDVYTDHWKKFDYLEFSFAIKAQSVSSVSASLGSTVIPCEVSFVANDITTYESIIINVRLDLTNINRTSSEVPTIVINGQLTPNAYNLVNFVSAAGFVGSSNGDLISFLFRDLSIKLSGWFSSLESALSGDTSSGDQFKEDSSGLISGLDDISASMDAVDRPSMGNINADFTGDISDAGVLMGNLFSVFTAESWLSRIFLASVTMGLLAYILYGKD